MSQVHTMQVPARTRPWVISSQLLLPSTSLPTSVSPGPVEDSMLVDILTTKSASLPLYDSWPCKIQLHRMCSRLDYKDKGLCPAPSWPEQTSEWDQDTSLGHSQEGRNRDNCALVTHRVRLVASSWFAPGPSQDNF